MKRALLLAVALLAGALTAAPPRAPAEPVPMHARALWVRGERVYVALLDTLSISAGHSLTFRDGKKLVATGAFTGERAGDVIAVRILTGSLGAVKKLERLSIGGEAPSTRAPRSVRWGYPSSLRRPLLFTCGACALRLERLGAPYRIVEERDDAYRLVRMRDGDDGSAWPDTIVVRLYDESSDQEIAFERGDIDAAVFWPGEASRHARDLTGPTRLFTAPREQGILIATGSGALDASDFAPMGRMNDVLFHGDLVPYLRPAPDGEPEGGATAGGRDGRALPFDVDSRIPGAGLLRRALAPEHAPGAGGVAPPPVRVAFLPVSIDPDSISQAALKSIPEMGDGPRSVRLFTMGCPVVAHADLVPFLERVGVGAFVNLFDCVPPEPRR